MLTPEHALPIEDVADAIRAGRPVRHHGPYRVLIGHGSLDFQPSVIADPVPTGAQILEAAGVPELVEYVAYRILQSGLLEELRSDETTDLRHAGAERFLVFRSDRSFRFQLNDRGFDWGAQHITGATLKKLAALDSPNLAVWFEEPGIGGRYLDDKEFVDLAKSGVERFLTRTREYRITVNTREKHVHTANIDFWELVRLAFPQAQPTPTTYYTITYKRGPKQNPEGSLVAGEAVHIQEGMAFNVTPTDKS